jgi:(E)-4-hydroxy-3-methylbut-2-enyl-diphosphate synthase
MIKRKKTKAVMIGNVKIGDMSPIAVQSMTNTKTADIKATVSQIKNLEEVGCEIIRLAVPDKDSAGALFYIKKEINIPIIADIHFDYRLAIASAKAGANALRINPGNIGDINKIREVVSCAKDLGISIRIGVNAGSLEKGLIEKYKGAVCEAMVESAIKNVNLLKDMDFHNIKISIKASDADRTIEAYRLFSSKSDIPLHIGLTEAGPVFSGLVKSSIALGTLLMEGIGDTIRVSLSADPAQEIRAGYEILKALNIRRRGPEIISCPTCGRCDINLFEIVENVEKALMKNKKDIKIAIMGCVVNGPGEAKEADIGIAGGKNFGVFFKKGKVLKKYPEHELVDILLKEIENIA